MRVLFVLAMMVLFLGSTSGICAAVSGYHITKDNQFGDASKEDLQTIIQYARDGDTALVQKALDEGYLTGTITYFKNGEPIDVEEHGDGLIKVRRPGETQTYWTIIQAIM